MLFFNFNTDRLVESKQLVIELQYENEKSSKHKNETQQIQLADIESCFFETIDKELGISHIRMNYALYDVIGIPATAFSVDEEKILSLDRLAIFALKQYAKIPILELQTQSLMDLGISLEFCKKISNSDLDSKLKEYAQKNHLECIHEEVLQKKVTNGEIVQKFLSKMLEIETEGNELIIVDPYLFSTSDKEYCDCLVSIIKKSKATSVIVITDKKNFCRDSFNCINNDVDLEIEVKFSKEFHDRFWISNRKKGFYTGTSFNGIGKKLSLINLLNDTDVKTIVETLKEKDLI